LENSIETGVIEHTSKLKGVGDNPQSIGLTGAVEAEIGGAVQAVRRQGKSFVPLDAQGSKGEDRFSPRDWRRVYKTATDDINY